MRHATAALAVLVSCLGTGACSASANLPFQVTPMAEFDDSVWEHLAGTQSEPFVLGEHGRIAIKVIDERGLDRDAILAIVRDGDVITEYADDQPYPSCLLLGFVAGAPVHVVVARERESRRCFVVTAYNPDPRVWSDDFRKRRR